MFMTSTAQMSEVASVAANRNITHAAFRLYVFLVMAADRRIPKGGFAPVGYEEIATVLPGVKGKPVTRTTLRDSLRELRQFGLIETAQSQEPSKYILVKLIRPEYVNAHELGQRILFGED